jgi:hypothetical protein
MKLNLLFLALATAVAAAPGPETPAVDANTNTNADSAGDVSILATRKWQANGGCKTDWSQRCHEQCVGEAQKKGYSCTDLDSDITGSNCFIGWSTCECTCFY